MKRIILFSVYLFSSIVAFSQKTVTGQVLDSLTNDPLTGATIYYNGNSRTTSGDDGKFSVPCDVSNIIVSFVGYEPDILPIKNCDEPITIHLVRGKDYLDPVAIQTLTTKKSLLSEPASITKLTATELKRGTGLFLDDAINANVPGVTMNRRAVASGQQFNIRGYGNGARGTNGISSNFDGQGYKVYLNGIPITDAEGITVMDDIDFGSIGNVEVIKGPAGSLYGLAIAGVVNLKTISAETGRTSIAQEAMIGDYGLQRYNTRIQIGMQRSSLLINYGKQKSDGFMTHTNSDKTFVNMVGEFQPNEKQSFSVYGGYSNSYDQRGGELTINQYKNKDYTGNPAYIKNNAHSAIISVRAGASHSYKFSNQVSNTTTVFGSGVNNNASSAGGWTDKLPVNFGLRSSFDTKFSLGENASLSGVTGVETQHQYTQVTGYPMLSNPIDPNGYNIIGVLRSNQAIITRTTSAFTEWTLQLPADLSLTAGVGTSSMEITLNDKFFVSNPTNAFFYYSKNYKGLVSPHAAINKIFSKAVSLYASYSKGYKAPVSSYFYIPFTGEVSKNLIPEVGNQFEAGSKGIIFKDKLNYELAAFYTKFTNKMTTVAVPNADNTATLYTYLVNGGEQKHKGVELLVKYAAFESQTSFFTGIHPFANFTYSDFTYQNFHILDKDVSGNAVAGVAKITANAGVDFFTKPGLYANVLYSFKDKVPITSDGKNIARRFSLLNAKAGFKNSLSQHFDIDAYVGVNNITGVQYYYMIFVNQLPDAYLPAPYKANYFGGVNLTYYF
jgi:iron complex outermembrane receptor protein